MESEVDLDTAPAMVISLADLQSRPELLQQLSGGNNIVYVEEPNEMVQIGDQQFYQVVTSDGLGQVLAMQNEGEVVSVLDQPQEVVMAEPEAQYHMPAPAMEIQATSSGTGKMVSILKPRHQLPASQPQTYMADNTQVVKMEYELAGAGEDIRVENDPGVEMDPVQILSSANAISTVHATPSESVVLVSSQQPVVTAGHMQAAMATPETSVATVTVPGEDQQLARAAKPTCTVVPMTLGHTVQRGAAPVTSGLAVQQGQAAHVVQLATAPAPQQTTAVPAQSPMSAVPVKSSKRRNPVSIDLTEGVDDSPEERDDGERQQVEKTIVKLEKSNEDIMAQMRRRKRRLEEGEILESDDENIEDVDPTGGVDIEEGVHDMDSDSESVANSEEDQSSPSQSRGPKLPNLVNKEREMMNCFRCQERFLPLRGITNSNTPMCLRCDVPTRTPRWHKAATTAETESQASADKWGVTVLKLSTDNVQPKAELAEGLQGAGNVALQVKGRELAQPKDKPKKVQLKVKAYHCSQCPKVFCMLDALRRHEINFGHGGDPGRFECDKCFKRFTMDRQLQRHIRMAHDENKSEPHQCQHCGKTFLLSNNLEDHMKTHSEERHFSCYVCPSKFQTSRSLAAHVRYNHTREEVDTAIGRSTDGGTLVVTVASEVKEEDSKEEIIKEDEVKEDEIIAEEIKAEEIKAEEIKAEEIKEPEMAMEGQEVVGVISVTGKEESDQAQKVRWVPDNKRYRHKCKECSALFDNEEHLAKHRASHLLGEVTRAFTCEKCEPPATFLSQAALTRHIGSTHGEDPEIPCMFCGQKFKELFHLTQHLMTHKVKCDYCSEVFSHQTRLDSHHCPLKLLKLNPPPFPAKEQIIRCTGAPYLGPPIKQPSKIAIPVQANSAEEKITVKTKTGETVSVAKATCFICDECGKAFCSQVFLAKHMRKQHSD